MCMLGNFACFFCRLLIFSKSIFLKNYFRNTIRVSNSLDSDQDRHSVGPDLDPNCLQSLSANDTRRQRVEKLNECLSNIFPEIDGRCRDMSSKDDRSRCSD